MRMIAAKLRSITVRVKQGSWTALRVATKNLKRLLAVILLELLSPLLRQPLLLPLDQRVPFFCENLDTNQIRLVEVKVLEDEPVQGSIARRGIKRQIQVADAHLYLSVIVQIEKRGYLVQQLTHGDDAIDTNFADIKRVLVIDRHHVALH